MMKFSIKALRKEEKGWLVVGFGDFWMLENSMCVLEDQLKSLMKHT